MRIGILTPSIYMYATRFSDRIFAPGDLVRHLVDGLVARGHEVTWFTAPEDARGSTLTPGNEELLTRDLQIRVFQDISEEMKEKISLYGTKMYYELDLVTRAYQAAKVGKVDLVHNFHSFGYFAHYFEELTGVSTIYTLHDPVPTADMLERWLFDRFPGHKYISLSDRQRGAFASHFFATVHNGVDLTKFPFSAKPGEGLVAVGRMIPEKGQDTAITVAKQLAIPLTFATWMNEGIKKSAYYKEKIEPFVDGKNIVVNSLMQGTNLASMYQNARALIFPIQWEEPFGLVMVESMSSGTPVVAYNRGSVSEIVQDGVTGFIVDDDNPTNPTNTTNPTNWVIKQKGVAGLVEAIRRIGEIDRAACRKHVEENFTIDKMVEGYENVYKKVLQKT